MKTCPTCDGPVQLIADDKQHYAYRSLLAIEATKIEFESLTGFVRDCDARQALRPHLSMRRIMHDELARRQHQLLHMAEDERG